MTDASGIPAERQRLDALFRTKAKAEIARAESLEGAPDPVRGDGDELADVMLVKGEPGPADLASGYALAGADGPAAVKALDALGVAGTRFAACSRPREMGPTDRSRRLRLLVEAVDPRVIVALDPVAGADVADAFGVPVPEPGVRTWVLGRTLVALDGLERSLDDPALKRRVWKQMQCLAPEGPAAT